MLRMGLASVDLSESQICSQLLPAFTGIAPQATVCMVLLLLPPRQLPGSHGDDGDALRKAQLGR